MELTWWGTAAFQIKTGDHTLLIDPYLTRAPTAVPMQSLTPGDVAEAEQIFTSHGHFDHVYDVPEIAQRTGATVYCCPIAAETMRRNGLGRERITEVTKDGAEFEFDGYRAEAIFSQHVKFDTWLLVRTLTRINLRIPKYRPWFRDYPVGQVMSWRFNIGGTTIQHFGSAGSTPDELDRHGKTPPDVLLVPLQGHTHICEIAVEYVKALKPSLAIPHHQDNFFPPISASVDITPFVEGVRRECPDTQVRVMNLNETLSI